MLVSCEHTFGLVDISPLKRHACGHMHTARKHVDRGLEVDLLVYTKVIGIFEAQTVCLHLGGGHHWGLSGSGRGGKCVVETKKGHHRVRAWALDRLVVLNG